MWLMFDLSTLSRCTDRGYMPEISRDVFNSSKFEHSIGKRVELERVENSSILNSREF